MTIFRLLLLLDVLLLGIGTGMHIMRARLRRQLNAIPLPLPIAPQGVVVYFADGSKQGMEMRFAGMDEQGVFNWIATVPLTEEPVSVTCEYLPPFTSITLGGNWEIKNE